MNVLTILALICVHTVYCSFGNVLPTEFHTSSSDYDGPWIRYSQPNVEIIPHDPIVERGMNLTLRCVAHGIQNVQEYRWKVPFHMLMEPFKLAERDKKRTLEVIHLNGHDHNKEFVCEVTNDLGQVWSQSVTVRIMELMQPHSTQTVIFKGRTVNFDNRNSKSEDEKHSSGVGTAIGVGLVMGCIGVFIGIVIAVNLIRRRHASKVPYLDRATKRCERGRAVIPDEHYMSLNQPTNTSSTASSERYHVDLDLTSYHQKPQPPALPPPRVAKPVPPSRKRHNRHHPANKLHREAMFHKSKSMDSVYDTVKRSYNIQEYVKPTELQYGSCEYIDMLANLRNPPLQQTNNNNHTQEHRIPDRRTSLVDTYTAPVELFRHN